MVKNIGSNLVWRRTMQSECRVLMTLNSQTYPVLSKIIYTYYVVFLFACEQKTNLFINFGKITNIFSFSKLMVNWNIKYNNDERIMEKTKGLSPLAYRQQSFVQLGY